MTDQSEAAVSTLTRAGAEEFTQALEAVLEGNAMSLSGAWRLRADAIKRDVPAALGMTRREWVDRLAARFGRYRIADDRRTEVAKLLEGEGMKDRAIADALGVGKDTVARDLGHRGADAPPVAEDDDSTGDVAATNGANAPPDPEDLAAPVAPKTDVEHAAHKDGQSHARSDASRADRLAEDAAAKPAGWELMRGDCRELLPPLNEPAALLLTDPPYGLNYRSGRRWASTAQPIIGDDTDALALLADALDACAHVTTDAHALIFCSWREESDVRALLSSAGFKVRSAVVWAKNEPGTGDLRHSFGPMHERLVHATRGNAQMRYRLGDVITCARVTGGPHPTEKPQALLRELIRATTNPDDLVLDPFAGVASTLIAARDLGRRAWGAELEPAYYEEGMARLNAS